MSLYMKNQEYSVYYLLISVHAHLMTDEALKHSFVNGSCPSNCSTIVLQNETTRIFRDVVGCTESETL